MDFDTHPSLFDEFVMDHSGNLAGSSLLAQNYEFEDLFPCNGKTLDSSPQDLEISRDSPVSLDLYCEDTMFNINKAPPSLSDTDEFNFGCDRPNSALSQAFDGQSVLTGDLSPRQDTSPSPALENSVASVDDELIESDRQLLAERMRPYDKFPLVNDWPLERRIDRILELSPCMKYSKDFLLNIDSVEDPEQKVDILIELVCRIKQNFQWNYVDPTELFKPYTSASSCKKEKKKDAEGHVNPKRPMNAFMIWSKMCRGLISQICPQLHNATISKKLGVWWRTFSDSEKDVFEKEKATLTKFHQVEFPAYKYRPRKKAAKKNESKPEVGPKEKPSRKRKAPSTKQPLPTDQPQQAIQPPRQPQLRAINISESHTNLDPALQRKLQSKMNVKIDPNMRRGVSLSQGGRFTAINLADLTSLQATSELTTVSSKTPPASSSSGPLVKRLCIRTMVPTSSAPASTPAAAATSADVSKDGSTVFDTPNNSPHTPVTPVTPTESNLVVPTTSQVSQPCFDFNLTTTQRLLMSTMPPLSINTAATTESAAPPTTSNFMLPIGSVYKTSPILNAANNTALTQNNNTSNNKRVPILNPTNIVFNQNNNTNNSSVVFSHNNNTNNSSAVFSHSNNTNNSSAVFSPNNNTNNNSVVFNQNNNKTSVVNNNVLLHNNNVYVKSEPLSPQYALTIETEDDRFVAPVFKAEPKPEKVEPKPEMTEPKAEMTEPLSDPEIGDFDIPDAKLLDLNLRETYFLPYLASDMITEFFIKSGTGTTTNNDNDAILNDFMECKEVNRAYKTASCKILNKPAVIGGPATV